MRILKWIGLGLAAILLVVVAALVLIRFIIDPNDFKYQISVLVKDTTGYRLSLQGDLSWSFYPILGFESNQAALAASADLEPFLTVANMALGIRVLPLFSGELQVDQLQIEGVDARFSVDQAGQSNWQVIDGDSAAAAVNPQAPAPSPSPSQATSEEAAGPLPQVSIPLVRVLDAQVHYRDASGDNATDISINVSKLELTNVQAQEPVTVLLEAGLAQSGGATVSLSLQGELLPDLEKQHFLLAPLQINATLDNVLPAPISLDIAAELDIDLPQDQARFTLQQLQTSGVSVQGELVAQGITSQPSYQGRLSSRPIKLPVLFQALALEMPTTASADVFKTADFALTFSGDSTQAKLSDLLVHLDSSTLSGRVGVTDFTTQALTFDLLLDRINVDHYLPASDEGAAATDKPAAGGAAPASESLLPVELLRGLNMAGHLRANQVILQQETLNNLVLRVEAQQGVLQVTQLSTELLQGNLNGRFVLDARGARPSLTSDVDINEIELTGISSRFMADSLLSGKASLTLDAKADGNTVDELLQSALGQLHLNLDQGVLHGVNLNAVVVDALRDKLSTVEYLYPDYQEKLPRQLRKDTEISKLIADAKVENGQLIMPKFEFFTGESGIDASGRIDLLEQGFDYQFGIVLSSIERNKYLKGTRWPVRCNGQLSGAPADWCRPDIKAMGSILSQAASKAIKDKGAAELGDKVGLEAEDREQLKDEVQEKLEAEEERAKRKLQDKLDKWLKR